MKCIACEKECEELVKDGPYDVCKACTDEHYDLMFESMDEWRQMVDFVAERRKNGIQR